MNIIKSEIKTMSSREIAELTGKQLSHVHRDFKVMADDLGFPGEYAVNTKLMPSPNMDLGFSYERDKQGRISNIFLNKELTLTLVSGYNTILRNSIIKRWQELEAQQLPQIPQTYAEALLEAGRLAQIVDEQSEQLAIAAPKVEVYEALADRKGDVSTTIIAKQLGMTAIKLNRFLRDNGVKWEKADLPKAGYSEWFNVVSDVKNGHEFTQCLVTPLGQIEIVKLFNNAK